MNTKNYNAETAFWEAVKLAGGEKACGTSLMATLWAECHKDARLQELAKRYLYGTSQRAEQNLTKLREALLTKFGW